MITCSAKKLKIWNNFSKNEGHLHDVQFDQPLSQIRISKDMGEIIGINSKNEIALYDYEVGWVEEARSKQFEIDTLKLLRSLKNYDSEIKEFQFVNEKSFFSTLSVLNYKSLLKLKKSKNCIFFYL